MCVALSLLVRCCLGSAVGGVDSSTSLQAPGLASPLGLLSILAPTCSSFGCPWDTSGSDSSQSYCSAIVQTLLDASLFNNFFSRAVLFN